MKRLIDILGAASGLLIASPVLLVTMFLIWRQDRHSPFYLGQRVGKNMREFKMVKLRSMTVNADKSGVDSTSANDNRITKVGQFVRRYKLDELTQLWNVLLGEMSLVGPRPNVKREVDLYTDEEKLLLSVRPGITDLSSIVFSDEGDILAGSDDPDLRYNQVIRPWKSRLGLLYIRNISVMLDIKIIFATIIAIIDKKRALGFVNNMLSDIGADDELIKVCLRDSELIPHPPPGASQVVQSR